MSINRKTVYEGAALTELEKQSVGLLAEGLTYAETAEQHSLSAEAVASRLYRARIKLGARNSAHMAAIWTERRIIEALAGEAATEAQQRIKAALNKKE